MKEKVKKPEKILFQVTQEVMEKTKYIYKIFAESKEQAVELAHSGNFEHVHYDNLGMDLTSATYKVTNL